MRTDFDVSGGAFERPADLTAQWLTQVLCAGEVREFTVQRIGTGQMSECYRVALTYAAGAGPASIVLKVAAADPTSRQTGQALGLYEREVRFYTDIAPTLTAGGTGPVARCYHSAIEPDTGIFDLVLSDAAPAVVGDEIRGATVEAALLAVTELGRLHGPLLGDPGLAGADWLNREAPVTAELLAAYHRALGADLGIEAVRDGVRRQSFFGVMMAIVSSMLVSRTARGDEMFMTMLTRHCAQVLDTDALAVL